MSSGDSVHGRALRPLMPRPLFNNTFSSLVGNNHHFHNPKLTSWTHPTLCDYGGKRGVAAAPLVSSRWNPTAEQVQALEEMYRRGTRTPSAEQIQQIAAKLRRFGKIEGKNVFYWFQNHKARDRQKKRRQLQLLAANNHIPHRKQSGLCRKYLEMEQQPKKLPTMSKCSTGSKYGGGEMEESKRERWTSTSSSSSSCNLSLHKIIDEKASPHENAFALNLGRPLPSENDDFEGGVAENRTLELFPLMGSGVSTLSSTKEEMDDVSSTGNKRVPNQFFEFLPTKN